MGEKVNQKSLEDGYRLECMVRDILDELGILILAGREKLVDLKTYNKYRFRGVDFIIIKEGIELECKNLGGKRPHNRGESWFNTKEHKLRFSEGAYFRILIATKWSIAHKYMDCLKKMGVYVIDTSHKLEKNDSDYKKIKDSLTQQITQTLTQTPPQNIKKYTTWGEVLKN